MGSEQYAYAASERGSPYMWNLSDIDAGIEGDVRAGMTLHFHRRDIPDIDGTRCAVLTHGAQDGQEVVATGALGARASL